MLVAQVERRSEAAISPTTKPGLKLAAIGLREGGDGEVPH